MVDITKTPGNEASMQIFSVHEGKVCNNNNNNNNNNKKNKKNKNKNKLLVEPPIQNYQHISQH